MPYSHFSPTGKNDGNRKDAAFDKLTYLCLYTEKSRVGTSVTSLSPNGSVHPHNSRNRRSILKVVLLGNARKVADWHIMAPKFFCNIPESVQPNRMLFSPLHAFKVMFTFTV